jgi:hypothetical protein
MLKIKDNVDLKELEKYGFEECYWSYYKRINYEYYEVKIDIEFKKRYIFIQNDYYDCDYACYIPDVIYDLIKDGLVEKVN